MSAGHIDDNGSLGTDSSIVCRNIGKAFDGKEALHDVSFEARAGRVIGLLGENGAGKSTLLRILCGALAQDGGTVAYFGRELAALERMRASAMLFGGETGLYHELTGRENIRYFARLRHMEKDAIDARISRLAKRFSATEFLDKRVEQMSTGMRQRIAIIRAVIHDPDVILFDEPDSGLDFKAARVVDDFLLGSARDGKVVIVSSHSIGDILSTCDELLILKEGQLVGDYHMGDITAGRSTHEAHDVLFGLVSGGEA